jgi:arsenical pump membrane protein
MGSMPTLIPVFLFVAVLTLVIWRPKNLAIGWPAAGGAALALLFHLVPLAQVVTVVRLVWDATVAFVGIIINSILLDEIGVFEWAALHLSGRAGATGRRLFVNALLLGALVAALFANDGAALILTPLVYEQARALGWSPRAALALVMAGGFIADFTSTPLIVSNLVNILSADYFHLGFAGYAARMVPVDLVTLALTIGLLYLLYRRDLPAALPGRLPDPRTAIRDPALFRWALILMGVLLVGFFATEPFHVPVSLVVVAVTLAFLVLAHRSPAISVRRTLRSAPWAIVMFSIGMYVVVFALRDAGLLTPLTAALRASGRAGLLSAVMVTGGLSAGLSAVMNNLPAVMMVALAVHGTGLAVPLARTMAYANVIGADLGPKLTPIGSLATLLWLHVLERRGMRIGWGYYIKIGVLLTLPVLAGALAALYGWTRLLGWG